MLRWNYPQHAITTYDDTFYLDGEASDAGGLQSLAVNGVEWLKPEHRGASLRRFSGFLPIAGTSVIHVVVKDVAGNLAERTLTVTQQQPDYLDEQFRLRAALVPLRKPMDEGSASWERVNDYIGSGLLRSPARFRVLTRDPAEWDQVLRELRIGLSDLADARTAIRAGGLLTAELLLMGALYRAKSLGRNRVCVEMVSGTI